jgi:acyl-CoA dehydrogenase
MAVSIVKSASMMIAPISGQHQKLGDLVHGAIGFAHEHCLHRLTRRLWSWRDEFGTESRWSRERDQR